MESIKSAGMKTSLPMSLSAPVPLTDRKCNWCKETCADRVARATVNYIATECSEEKREQTDSEKMKHTKRRKAIRGETNGRA